MLVSIKNFKTVQSAGWYFCLYELFQSNLLLIHQIPMHQMPFSFWTLKSYGFSQILKVNQ